MYRTHLSFAHRTVIYHGTSNRCWFLSKNGTLHGLHFLVTPTNFLDDAMATSLSQNVYIYNYIYVLCIHLSLQLIRTPLAICYHPWIMKKSICWHQKHHSWWHESSPTTPLWASATLPRFRETCITQIRVHTLALTGGTCFRTIWSILSSNVKAQWSWWSSFSCCCCCCHCGSCWDHKKGVW